MKYRDFCANLRQEISVLSGIVYVCNILIVSETLEQERLSSLQG